MEQTGMEKRIKIGKWITLRPYGNRLLSPMASIWLTSMSIIIYLMCLVEGATWGLIATFFFEDTLNWLGWPAGILVALLFYIFDTSIANTDLPHDPKGKGLKLVLLFKSSVGGVVFKLLLRVLVVAGSMYITAPYLSQLMLHVDINAYLNQSNAQVRQKTITDVHNRYARQLSAENEKLEDLHERRTREAAGTGESKLRGIGPVYNALTAQIEAAQQRYNDLTTQYHKKLDLARKGSREQLQKEFGAHFVPDTLAERKKIQDRLLADNTGQQKGVVDIARLLLFLVFATMMVLKILQPKGIYIYQSEMLQGLYEKYRNGGLDQYIAPEERYHGISPMNAYRFHDWVYTSYLQDIDREDREDLVTGYKNQIALLKDEAGELRLQIGEKQRIIEDHSERHQELSGDLRGTSGQLESNACLIAEQERELQTVKETMGKGLPPEARVGFYSTHREMVDLLGNLRGEGQRLAGRKNDLEATCSRISNTIAAIKTELNELRAMENVINGEIARYKKMILETHDKRLQHQREALEQKNEKN